MRASCLAICCAVLACRHQAAEPESPGSDSSSAGSSSSTGTSSTSASSSSEETAAATTQSTTSAAASSTDDGVAPPQPCELGAPSMLDVHLPDDLEPLDIDLDGDLDLAVRMFATDAGSRVLHSRICVLLNAGDGTFPEGCAPEMLEGDVITMDAGDFDGDGRTDLVATMTPGSDARVLLAQPGGGFAMTAATVIDGSTYGISSFDIDGDADVDVLVGTAMDVLGVHVLRNAGDGTLTEAAFLPGSEVIDIAVADFDADGITDIGYADVGGLRIGLGDGEGNFASDGPLIPQTYPYVITPLDLDGDGDLDLAFDAEEDPDVLSTRFWTALNRGDGEFDPPTIVDDHQVRAIVAYDLDDDGRDDLLTSRAGEPGIYYRHSEGDGTFTIPMVAGWTVHRLIRADLDGDGIDDIIGSGDDGVLVFPVTCGD